MKHLQLLCAAAAREGIADGLHCCRREAAELSSSRVQLGPVFGIQKYHALERRVSKWGSVELQKYKISMETKSLMLWNETLLKMRCSGSEI